MDAYVEREEGGGILSFTLSKAEIQVGTAKLVEIFEGRDLDEEGLKAIRKLVQNPRERMKLIILFNALIDQFQKEGGITPLDFHSIHSIEARVKGDVWQYRVHKDGEKEAPDESRHDR